MRRGRSMRGPPSRGPGYLKFELLAITATKISFLSLYFKHLQKCESKKIHSKISKNLTALS